MINVLLKTSGDNIATVSNIEAVELRTSLLKKECEMRGIFLEFCYQ